MNKFKIQEGFVLYLNEMMSVPTSILNSVSAIHFHKIPDMDLFFLFLLDQCIIRRLRTIHRIRVLFSQHMFITT